MLLIGSVVHQALHLAKLLHHLFHRIAAELRIGEVARDQQRATPFGFHGIASLLRIHLLFRQINDCDIGAFARVQHSHSTANSGVAAGDQRDFAFQLLCAAIVWRLVAWLWIDLSVNPRTRLLLLRKWRLRLTPLRRLSLGAGIRRARAARPRALFARLLLWLL